MDNDHLFHPTMSPLLEESGHSVIAEEAPPLDRSHDHAGVDLSQFEARPMHQHQQIHEPLPSEACIPVTDVTLLRPDILEDGDPLNLPTRRQRGVTLIDRKSALLHAIKKHPSNQELATSTWEKPSYKMRGRSKTGLRITVPDRTTPKTIPTGPILYDKSAVYLYSSSSSGGEKTTHSFGAIGDHRSPPQGPSSGPLVSSIPESLPIEHPDTAIEPIYSALHDLVESSVPDCDQYELFAADDSTGSLTAVSTAPLEHDAANSTASHRLATAAHSQDQMLQDPAVTPTHESNRYGLLMARNISPMQSAATSDRIAPSRLRLRTRRRHSMTHRREGPLTTPVRLNKNFSKSAPCQDEDPSLIVPTSNSLLQIHRSLGESGAAKPPTWRRSGPPFGSSTWALANSQQGRRLLMGGPESTVGDVSFQDRLDPEEFSLPYGVSTEAENSRREGTNMDSLLCTA